MVPNQKSLILDSSQYGDTVLDYTGSDVEVERLNSTKPLRKDMVVEVSFLGFFAETNSEFRQYSGHCRF